MDKKYFKYFDLYQILTVPLIVVFLLFSFDLQLSPIKLGILINSSEDYYSYSQSQINAFLLAAKHINEAGGIDGRSLNLFIREHMDTPEDAARTARDLIYYDAVPALIGGFTPATTRAIQTLTEQAHVPFIIPFCTHYELTSNASAYSFRTITDDLGQFDSLLNFALLRHNIRKPALIYDEEFYGSNSAEKFMESAIKKGQQTTVAVSYAKNTLNFKRQIEILISSNPDSLVVLAPPKDSALIVRHVREAGFKLPVLGGNWFSAAEFINLSGVYSESAIATLPFNPRLGGQRADYFLSEYQQTYSNQVDFSAAMAYESVMLLAMAMNSEEITPESVKDYLSSMHAWESISGSGGFDFYGNQIRPAEIAIIKERQSVPISLEELF